MPRESGEVIKALIRKGSNETDCWQWLGKTLLGGYGVKQLGGRSQLAHRWVYSLFNGWIPEAMVINHLCRNRACVNPDHLEVTTTAGNCRHGLGAKLNVNQVREIKMALKTARWGDVGRIAKRFDVSRALISDIKYGRAWKEV